MKNFVGFLQCAVIMVISLMLSKLQLLSRSLEGIKELIFRVGPRKLIIYIKNLTPTILANFFQLAFLKFHLGFGIELTIGISVPTVSKLGRCWLRGNPDNTFLVVLKGLRSLPVDR